MFKFDKSDLQRIAVSSVGAVALSATCILGVSSPARAAAAPIDGWRTVVQAQLDAANETSLGLSGDKVLQAVLAVHCSADRRCGDPTIARSSGDEHIDRTALATARDIAYPALPARYAGRPINVEIRLFYGANEKAVTAARLAAADGSDIHYADRDTRRGGGASQVLAK